MKRLLKAADIIVRAAAVVVCLPLLILMFAEMRRRL